MPLPGHEGEHPELLAHLQRDAGVGFAGGVHQRDITVRHEVHTIRRLAGPEEDVAFPVFLAEQQLRYLDEHLTRQVSERAGFRQVVDDLLRRRRGRHVVE